MTKKNELKKQDEIDENFDFGDVFDDDEGFHDDDMVAEAMKDLAEVSNNQVLLAIELTKLVIDKSSAKERSEQDVFATFSKASTMISESFPWKAAMEKLFTQE